MLHILSLLGSTSLEQANGSQVVRPDTFHKCKHEKRGPFMSRSDARSPERSFLLQ